jgi:hypothetical protein
VGVLKDAHVLCSKHLFEFGYYSKLVRDKRKVQGNGVLWNVIIDGYTRMEDLIASRDSFDSMPNKSLVSWNAMISDMHRIDILWRQWRCFVVSNWEIVSKLCLWLVFFMRFRC